MKNVQHHIEVRQSELDSHALFVRLRQSPDLREVLPALPLLTFWVLAFQDALRMNTALVTEKSFRTIARHHLHEDSGHDQWFIQDVEHVCGSLPPVVEVFEEKHRQVREATYALLAEVFRFREDVERIAFIMTLESTGQVFFPNIVTYFREVGIEPELKYFSQNHLDVEKDHEIVEQAMLERLSVIELSDLTRQECIAMVDRCYLSFERIFDTLLSAMAEPDQVFMSQRHPATYTS